MRNLTLALAVMAALAGCGNALFDDDMRAAVREKLKDPDSAKWEGKLRYKDFACIKYNAKNSYGGYGGSTWAILESTGGSGWYVTEMSAQSCYEFDLEKLSKRAAEKKAAEAVLLAEFKKRKLITESVQNAFDLPDGPCQQLLKDLGTYTRLAIDADSEKDKAEWQAKYDEGFKQVATVKCS